MAIKILNQTLINRIERFFEHRNWLLVFLLILMGLVFYIRKQIYQSVSLNFIDSDQPFMWAGAVDYAKGLFYEPRFYGQNYNTFFEGLISVPLLWMGVPVYKALPLATQFIFLFPFIFSSIYLFIKGNKLAALFGLCILLCLPSGFDIMTSMPRGFVGGLFFSSFFVISFYKPNNFTLLAFNFVLLILGYFVNPNLVLISLPFVVYIFQFHYKNKRYYILMLMMLLLFLMLQYFFEGFYERHPDYVVYGYEHNFSIKFLIQNLKNLNQVFEYVSFFKEGKAFIFLISIILMGFTLFKQNKKAFIAFLSFVFVILFSFISEKSRDGVSWPWYSNSRLFICAPAFMFLFISLVNFKRSIVVTCLMVVSIIFSSFKIANFESNLKRLTDQKLWNGVHLVSIQSTLDAIDLYKKQCQNHQVDFLLISNGFWLNTYLDYGGPAIDKDFPNTYETRAERRFWVREKFDKKVINKFIFISSLYDFEQKAKGDFEIEKLDDYGLYLIKNNQLTTKQFIDVANKIELE